MLLREIEHAFRDWNNCEGWCRVSIFAALMAADGGARGDGLADAHFTGDHAQQRFGDAKPDAATAS